jgi:hypothetical protein
MFRSVARRQLFAAHVPDSQLFDLALLAPAVGKNNQRQASPSIFRSKRLLRPCLCLSTPLKRAG